MEIYPMKKLIIIYGLHLDQIQNHTTEERLVKLLTEKSFVVSNDLTDLDIVVYKSSDFSNRSKRTHIVVNLGNEITEIKYYTTKQ
jgi:hypothetical protein